MVGQGYTDFGIAEEIPALHSFRRTANDIEPYTALIVTRESNVRYGAIRKRPLVFHPAIECKARRIWQNTALGHTGNHRFGDLGIDHAYPETDVETLGGPPAGVSFDTHHPRIADICNAKQHTNR